MKARKTGKRKTIFTGSPVKPLEALSDICLSVTDALYRPVSLLGEKTRDILLFLSVSLCVVYYCMQHTRFSGLEKIGDFSNALFMLAEIILITALSIKKPAAHRFRNGSFWTVYFLFALSLIFACFFHPIRDGFMVFALTLPLVPVLVSVWAEREDTGKILEFISVNWVYLGLTFFVVSLVIVPPFGENLIKGRYAGITTNANRIGIMTVSIITACLYMILKNRHRPASILALSVSFYMLWISASRSSAAADIFVLLVFLIIVLKERNSEYLSLKSALSCLLVSVLLCAVLTFSVSHLSASVGKPGASGLTADETKTETVSKKTANADLSDSNSKRRENYSSSNGSDENVTLKDRIGGYSNLNELSSGRLEIYSQVIKNINLTGHDPKELELTYLGKAYSAHNAVLDFTFVCGLISGMLFLLIKLMMCIESIKILMTERIHYPKNWIMVLSSIAYLAASMLETQTTFISGSLVLTFYISMIIIEEKL